VSLEGPGYVARVRVLCSPDASVVGRVVTIASGTSCLVGRSPDAELSIDDSELSRQHLLVARDDDGDVTVTDCGTRNGSRVGARRLWNGQRRIVHDEVVRLGRSVLLVGKAAELPAAEAVDPWLAWLGRAVLALDHPVALGNVDGHELAAVLLDRPERRGPVIVVGRGDSCLDAGAAHRDATVVFDRPELTAIGEALAHLPRGECVAVIVGDGIPDVVEKLVGEPWCLTIPALRRRPDEVFRRTTARLGAAVGQFLPTALARWLLAPHTRESLDGALERLSALVSPGQTIDSRVVRKALVPGAAAAFEAASRRTRWRPTREELVGALDELSSVAAVAIRFGRERRQIYRWMVSLGVARDA
jgi:hypothetical protein